MNKPTTHWRFSMRQLLLLLSAFALLLGFVVISLNDRAAIRGYLEEDYASEERAGEVLGALVEYLGSVGFSETPHAPDLVSSRSRFGDAPTRIMTKSAGGIVRISCRIELVADEKAVQIEISTAGTSHDVVESHYMAVCNELERRLVEATK